MVLESSEPKENDKILKKNFFSKFWGVSSPPKTPLFRFLGAFGEARNPPKKFSKFYHFLWALNFPEPSSYLIFNFRKYF